MITEAFFNAQFFFVDVIVSLFPALGTLSDTGYTYTIDLLSTALYWFPIDLWIAILVNIVFWLTLQFGWAVIEWVYKKIPGVS